MALFYAEVLNYGAWTLDLANTSNAFRQQPLWDDRAPAAIAPEKSLPPVVHDALDNTIATISWTNADGSERSFAATSLTKLKDVTKQATTRTVDGETFERDDLGRYVNTETGEYLDAFEVPRPMTTGR
jgi:hypothetical protein